MAVTIKDVAALAGVSPSTVSRVCNDNPSISKDTRERVKKAMAELGYEMNVSNDDQASQSVRLVGIVLPPSIREAYENSFYLEAIRGISQVCNQRRVASTLVTGKDDAEVLQTIQLLERSGQVDGYIMLYSKRGDMVVDYLNEHDCLYVMIGKANQFTNQTICIDNDNLLAGREAAEYLYQLGHRKIAYLGSRDVYLYSADRKSGYQLALLQHELPVRPDYCVESEGIEYDDMEQLRTLLRREDRPTAIVVSDDLLAVALERVCVQLGLEIPQDVSIVSFNNSLFAQLTSPQLTSVDVNSFQLGSEAASQILNHAENPDLMAAKIVVPHHIVERSSCRRLESE